MHQIILYTSYFGNYKNIPAEYQCVSIANSKPNISIPTWNDIVPDWRDVKALKQNKLTSIDFAFRYWSKLNKLTAMQIYNYLRAFNAEAIVLLCWEQQYLSCHRYLLSQWLSYNLDLHSIEYKNEGEHNVF